MAACDGGVQHIQSRLLHQRHLVSNPLKQTKTLPEHCSGLDRTGKDWLLMVDPGLEKKYARHRSKARRGLSGFLCSDFSLLTQPLPLQLLPRHRLSSIPDLTVPQLRLRPQASDQAPVWEFPSCSYPARSTKILWRIVFSTLRPPFVWLVREKLGRVT